jgi:transposase
MRRSHRRLSPEQKLKIIKEVQTSGATTAEVCRRHGISTTLYYHWLSIADQAAKEALKGKRPEKPSQKEQRMRRDLERMKEVVAEITAENLELKKTFGE